MFPLSVKMITSYGEKLNILMATLSHQFCFICPEKGGEPKLQVHSPAPSFASKKRISQAFFINFFI